MDSCFQRIFDELRRMETRLGDFIEGHCGGPEHRVEDLGPIFDEELFFEDELVYDEEAGYFTTTCSAIIDMGLPVADGPLFNEESVHSAEYAVEQKPVFDEEDKGPVFDIEPISDRLGVDDLSTTRIGDFHPNTNMVDLDTTCSPAALFPPSSTSTIIDESVLFPGRAAAPLLTPDIKQSDGEVDTPAKCLMKCLSNGIDIITSVVAHDVAEEDVVPEPTQKKSGRSQPPALPDPRPSLPAWCSTSTAQAKVVVDGARNYSMKIWGYSYLFKTTSLPPKWKFGQLSMR